MTNSRPLAWRIYLIKLMLFAKKGGERREKLGGGGREEEAHSREGRNEERKEEATGREVGRADNMLVGKTGTWLTGHAPFSFWSSFLYF